MSQRRLSKLHTSALAVVAGVVAITVVIIGRPDVRTNIEFQALIDATSHQPVFAGWPAGGFSPSALLPIGTPGRATPNALVLESAVAVIEHARLDTSIDARRRGGVGLVAIGRFDDSIERFEELIAASPRDAALRNDLGVAYLTRGHLRGDWLDLVRALDAIERARDLNRQLIEASFNRALLSELLLPHHLSEQAWREFLELRPSTRWERAAQQRLTRLTHHPSPVDFAVAVARAKTPAGLDALVRSRTLTAREYLTESLLAKWGAESTSGVAAAPVSAPTVALAESLARVSNDPLAREIVQALDRSRGGARRELIEAHRRYGEAMALVNDDRISDASAPLESAAAAFAKHGSPMQYLATLQLTSGLNNRGDTRRSERLIDESIQAANARGYPTIRALAKWKRGLRLTFEARLDEAIREYTESLRNFDAIGETENAANMHNLLAEALQLLGDYRASGAQHAEALQRIQPFDHLRIRHQILTQAALTCLALHLPAAAARFQDALVENAIAWKAEGAQGIAYLQRAKSGALMGRDATADLTRAAQHIRRIEDAAFRGRFETELALARVQVFAGEAGRGIPAASDALAFLRNQQSFPRIPAVLFTRARLQVNQALANASSDALEGIAILEEQRRRMRDRPLQMSLLEKNLEGFLLLAHIEADMRHNPATALPYIERMRARGLLDALPQSGSAPADPLDVSRRQRGVVFICYAFDGNDLMIWSVRDGSVEYTRVGGVRDTLRRQLAMLEISFRSPGPSDVRATLSAISRTVFTPVQSRIMPDDHVVFLPDGELHSVPFSALDSADGAYLIERHSVSVAPSFTIFGSVDQRARAQASAAFRGAVVVAPSGAAGLVALPSTGSEASDIAALYQPVEAMTGAVATRSRFLNRASRFSVIHFAGHGVANHDQPAFSRLVFAADGNGPTDLTANDIARRRFDRTRLVILGACETAAGQVRPGEGVLSLARAFLGAGVPTVVGSLWDVDDTLTRELLTRFHRELARGAGVAAALRAAQLSMLHDPDAARRHPLAWAGFVVNGAASTAAINSSTAGRNQRGTN